MYKVIFSRYAEMDINEIILYYNDINPTYAVTLLAVFEKRVSELDLYPNRGRIVPELERENIIAYRELIEGNYRIIYSINGDRVEVHAIIDARRNLEDILIKKLMH